jgi:hypothetical protein
MNCLPGWDSAFLTGKTPLTSITQVLSATSNNSATITAPSGIQAGDLIVMLDAASADSSPPTAVVPTGFTSIFNVTDAANYRIIASYKKADGTEGGASITGMVGSGFTNTSAKSILVFRGNAPATTITVGDIGSQLTTGNPTAQTITASSGVAPLIVFGFYVAFLAGSLVNPRTFTVSGSAAKDGEIQSLRDGSLNDADTWQAWKIYNTSPADVVVDMDDEGDNFLGSCYIQMAN